MKHLPSILSVALFCALVHAPVSHASEALQTASKGGHIVLIRHAYAPGTGDPADFRIGDCATQRNLDGRGRRQAQRIGTRLRKAGLEGAEVYSSQWCRCLDTAKLLGLGPVRELPALNSFFGRPAEEKPRMAALRSWLAQQKLDRPVVLVTHQVTITAFSGVFPSSGEVVVMRRMGPGKWKVAGTVETAR